MSLGLLFWLLFILWIVLRLYVSYRGAGEGGWEWVMIAVLLFVLGWGVFGFIVKG